MTYPKPYSIHLRGTITLNPIPQTISTHLEPIFYSIYLRGTGDPEVAAETWPEANAAGVGQPLQNCIVEFGV